MFEFSEARRKISSNGMIVATSIARNAALWDFADKHGVPAYNFRGSVGTVFFMPSRLVTRALLMAENIRRAVSDKTSPNIINALKTHKGAP